MYNIYIYIYIYIYTEREREREREIHQGGIAEGAVRGMVRRTQDPSVRTARIPFGFAATAFAFTPLCHDTVQCCSALQCGMQCYTALLAL